MGHFCFSWGGGVDTFTAPMSPLVKKILDGPEGHKLTYAIMRGDKTVTIEGVTYELSSPRDEA